MTPAEKAREWVVEETRKGIAAGIGSDQFREVSEAIRDMSTGSFSAALDFAEAVEKALQATDVGPTWRLESIQVTSAAFNAKLLSALPGGGAPTAVKGGRDGDE